MQALSDKRLFLVLILAVALTVAALAVSQSGTRFDIRQRASIPTGPVLITLETNATDRYVKDVFPVRIMLNTNGHTVSQAAVRLTYPVSASDLDVVDQLTGQTGIQISPNAENLGSGMTTSRNITQLSGGQMLVDYTASTDTAGGYSNTSPTLLATVWMKANTPIASKILRTDPVRTVVLDAANGADLLQDVAPLTLSFTADTQAPTVTITAPVEDAFFVDNGIVVSWTGTDLPARPADTPSQLQYAYTIDDLSTTVPTSFSATTSAVLRVDHGLHNFKVWARDSQSPPNMTATPTVVHFQTEFQPNIFSITPQFAAKGQTITISGENFTDQDVAQYRWVLFGTTAIVSTDPLVQSWTDSQIVIKIPSTANGNTITVRVGRNTAEIARMESHAEPYTYGVFVKFQFNLEGITQNRGPQTVSLSLKRTNAPETVQEFVNQTTDWNTTSGSYEVTVGPINPEMYATATDYIISIDDFTRLRKNFTVTADLTPGSTTTYSRIATTDVIPLADFNATQTNPAVDFDNKFNATDITIMVNNFHQLETTVTTQIKKFDVNGDGVINVNDLAWILQQYTQTETQGDTFP